VWTKIDSEWGEGKGDVNKIHMYIYGGEKRKEGAGRKGGAGSIKKEYCKCGEKGFIPGTRHHKNAH